MHRNAIIFKLFLVSLFCGIGVAQAAKYFYSFHYDRKGLVTGYAVSLIPKRRALPKLSDRTIVLLELPDKTLWELDKEGRRYEQIFVENTIVQGKTSRFAGRVIVDDKDDSLEALEIRTKVARYKAASDDRSRKIDQRIKANRRKIDQEIKADQIASLVKYCPGYASMSDKEKAAELQKLCPVTEFRDPDGRGYSLSSQCLLFQKPEKRPSSGRLKRFFSFNRRNSSIT